MEIKLEPQPKARRGYVYVCAWNKGLTGIFNHTEETKKRISETMKRNLLKGEESPYWKGENAKYFTKHWWIKKIKGSASNYKCKCGKQALDWSNIDHKYRRKLEDYIAMCRKCHFKYDKLNNLWGKKYA